MTSQIGLADVVGQDYSSSTMSVDLHKIVGDESLRERFRIEASKRPEPSRHVSCGDSKL